MNDGIHIDIPANRRMEGAVAAVLRALAFLLGYLGLSLLSEFITAVRWW